MPAALKTRALLTRALLTRAPLTRAVHQRVVALLLAVLSLGALLVSPAAASPHDVRRYTVTAAQERVVLGLIDDICGDTWCEGEHAMRFRRFDCHPRRGCLLVVDLASWSHDPLQWQRRSARIAGFLRYRDMVTTTTTTAAGGDRSLQPAFYEAVGRAVGRMTDSVR